MPVLPSSITKRGAIVPAILCLCCSTSLFAEHGRVVGRVFDAQTGKSIAAAKVIVLATGRSAVTDADGMYSIPGLPAGEYTIRSASSGYRGARAPHVRVADAASSELNFALTPYRRRRTGGEALSSPDVTAPGPGCLGLNEHFRQRISGARRRDGVDDRTHRERARRAALFRACPGGEMSQPGSF